MKSRALLLVPVLVLATAGCSGGSPADTGIDTADATGDASTDTTDATCGTPRDSNAGTLATCTTTLTASIGGAPDAGTDDDLVQTAFVNANATDVLCFQGTFHFHTPLSIPTQSITLQGATDGSTVFDFAALPSDSANSILATGADGFTMQWITVKNAAGNGVRVEGVTGVTFNHVTAAWDDGANTANGDYAIYPVGCTNVLVQYCDVSGAADTGVYVGQSHDVVVAHNTVHGNVGGIEIENCTNSDVYDNDSFDNTGGILVFNLPGLMDPGGGHAKVHGNRVYSNNQANYCHPGGVVCGVPQGLGIMNMAAHDTEITGNDIHDNDTFAVLVVDYRTQFLHMNLPMLPAGYDPAPAGICIHDNTYANNGTMALSPYDALQNPATGVVPDVVWDGDWAATPLSTDCTDNSRVQLCLPAAGNSTTTFECGDGPNPLLFMYPSYDITVHNCTCAGQACVTF